MRNKKKHVRRLCNGGSFILLLVSVSIYESRRQNIRAITTKNFIDKYDVQSITKIL